MGLWNGIYIYTCITIDCGSEIDCGSYQTWGANRRWPARRFIRCGYRVFFLTSRLCVCTKIKVVNKKQWANSGFLFVFFPDLDEYPLVHTTCVFFLTFLSLPWKKGKLPRKRWFARKVPRADDMPYLSWSCANPFHLGQDARNCRGRWSCSMTEPLRDVFWRGPGTVQCTCNCWTLAYCHDTLFFFLNHHGNEDVICHKDLSNPLAWFLWNLTWQITGGLCRYVSQEQQVTNGNEPDFVSP